MIITRRKEILLDILAIKGRIDGLTSSEIKHAFDLAINEGQRHLIVDLKGVSYMSSAGLRIILETHKSLKIIGGELILLSIPPGIAEIFKVSGMAPMLNIFQDLPSVRRYLNIKTDGDITSEVKIEGITFRLLTVSDEPGRFYHFGSPEKLFDSSYSEPDIIKVDQSEILYGTGISALGNDYLDFRDLFGESVILKHHFFSYPPVKKPVVDYSFYTKEYNPKINFLHGFGFTGNFCSILHFESKEEGTTVSKLVHAAGTIARSNIFGVVLLSLSGGILGMCLKRSPILENRPGEKKILERDIFHEWMDYSPEEEGLHKTIAGTGIAVKDPEKLDPERQRYFPKDSGLHIHAAVFENGLWSNKLADFEPELERVIRNFEVEKVIHLLPGTNLVNGFIGIINLDNI